MVGVGEVWDRLILTSIDLLLVAFATVLAIMLRGNFTMFKMNLQFDTLHFHFPWLCIRCFSPGRAGSNALAVQFSCGPLADYRFDCAGYPARPCLYLRCQSARGGRALAARNPGRIDHIAILISARAAARFWFARQIYKNGNGRVNWALRRRRFS